MASAASSDAKLSPVQEELIRQESPPSGSAGPA